MSSLQTARRVIRDAIWLGPRLNWLVKNIESGLHTLHNHQLSLAARLDRLELTLKTLATAQAESACQVTQQFTELLDALAAAQAESIRMNEKNFYSQPTPIFLGDRVLASTHRGDLIYLSPTDVDLTPSILLYGKWESDVEKVLVGLLRPNDIVIDIGSNVGYHVLGMAHAVYPGGVIHAFEANPDLMRLLKATMFINGISNWLGEGRVCLYEKAAIDKPGQVTLASAFGHGGSGHIITENPLSDYGPLYQKRVEVPAIRIDDMLGERVETVNLIHMDIEGSEPLALRGAETIIGRSPAIKLIIEWSVGMMRTRADVSEFVEWLCDNSFRFWAIGAGPILTEIDKSSVLNLPHCDLVLSREVPSL